MQLRCDYIQRQKAQQLTRNAWVVAAFACSVQAETACHQAWEGLVISPPSASSQLPATGYEPYLEFTSWCQWTSRHIVFSRNRCPAKTPYGRLVHPVKRTNPGQHVLTDDQMILTGPKIEQAVKFGDILIDPYDPTQINPNSYNYRLGEHLLEISSENGVDRKETSYHIPTTGLLLRPHRIYLGVTHERFASSKYAMTLLGRSSLGRLGLFLNLSSDLGHVGSNSRWTLELAVVQPLVIYPKMRVGQIAFWEVHGKASTYDGRYFGDESPTSCRDFSLRMSTSQGKVS